MIRQVPVIQHDTDPGKSLDAGLELIVAALLHFIKTSLLDPDVFVSVFHDSLPKQTTTCRPFAYLIPHPWKGIIPCRPS